MEISYTAFDGSVALDSAVLGGSQTLLGTSAADVLQVYAGYYASTTAVQGVVIDGVEGADSLNVGSDAHGTDAYAIGVANSDILTGSASDAINISATANSGVAGEVATNATAVALLDSSLSSGDGADSVSISAWAEGETTLAIAAENSAIDLGAGDDYLNMWANTSDTAYLDPAFGAVNTDIALGEGDDWINVSSLANGGQASVLDAAGLLSTDPNYYNLVEAGSGNDQLKIHTNALAQIGAGNSMATATAIEGYELLLEEGSDNLNVWSTAQGDIATAYGTYDTIIDSGDAALSTEVVQINSSSPGGSWWYDRLAGDSIQIGASANGDESYAVGAGATEIVTGTGDDNINISANSRGEAWGDVATTATAVALQDSSLSSGDGADDISLNAWAQGEATLAIAAENSVIDMGAGDDRLNMWANTSDTAYLDPAFGAVNTDIALGEGNDWMNVGSAANGGDASVLDAAGLLSTDPNYYNLVEAGSGNDQLKIHTNALAQIGAGNSMATATAIEGYELLLEEGSDNLNVWSTAQGDIATAYGTYDTIIDSGDAALSTEVVQINSSSPGGSWWYDRLAGDSIQIGASANGDESYAVGAGATEIVTGTGDDNINISANSRGEAWGDVATTATAVALQDSSLSSGDGADSVYLNAWAQGETTLAIAAENSTIDMGAGDDYLSMSATTSDTAYLDPAFGAINTNITLGGGNDIFSIFASATGSNEARMESTGLAGSWVSAGDGDDGMNIWSNAIGGATESWGVVGSVLDFGSSDASTEPSQLISSSMGGAWSKDDVLSVSVSANGISEARATGLLNSTVVSGTGDERLSFSAIAASNWAAGELVELAEAVGISASGINSGGGNDVISLSASAFGATTLAIGSLNSTVNAGTGNDNLTISANTNDNLYVDPAIGAQGSTLILGEGQDLVSVSAIAIGAGRIEATGLLNTNANLDGGDDLAIVNAMASSSDGEAVAVAIDGSTIWAGDGQDTVRLGSQQNVAGAFDAPGLAMRNSTVDLGTGNDFISLDGGTVNSTIIGAHGKDLLLINGVKLADIAVARVGTTAAYNVTYALEGSNYQLQLDSIETIQADDGNQELDTTELAAPAAISSSKGKKTKAKKPKKAKAKKARR